MANLVNTLVAGDRLTDADALESNNNRYRLNFDTDGILVLWDMSMAPQREVWSTPTAGLAPGGFATLQTDGNLVIYNNVNPPQPMWNTELAGAGQSIKGLHLVVEDNGKLVAYGITPIFDSSTWQTPVPSNPSSAVGGPSGNGVDIQTIAKDVSTGVMIVKTVISIFG